MRLLKIALANVNTTVGRVVDNTDRVIAAAERMTSSQATIGCFQEQVIGGYPAEDLVLWPRFVDAQMEQLRRFCGTTAESQTIFVVGLLVRIAGQIFNVAAVVHAGRILGFVPKEKLPTYNVFYEARTIARGVPGLRLATAEAPLGDFVFQFPFGRLAVEVCEDAWTPDGPMRRRSFSGAEIVINISASPYRIGIIDTRREMLATRSADNEVAFVYTNAIGGQDALVFDGGGFVFQNGRKVFEAPRFLERVHYSVIDLDRTTRKRAENTTWRTDCEAFQRLHLPVDAIQSQAETVSPTAHEYPLSAHNPFLPDEGTPPDRRTLVLDELFEALALGTRDYFLKTGAFRCFGVALSGGRDSMLALLVVARAVDLLGTLPDPKRRSDLIRAFYMPSRHSRADTRGAAFTIAQEIGVDLVESSIEDEFEHEKCATRKMLGDGELTAVTLQNIQARIRSARMWNWSNSAKGLFVQTSDMSEKAAGYTTIGGDVEGAFSVIADVPKTVVIALLQRRQEIEGFRGIALTLATEASPELTANQSAEEELMPFPILDAALALYAGEKVSRGDLPAALAPLFPALEREILEEYARRFVERFHQSIYKWVQSPLVIHVGTLDLDRERALQLPVVQRAEW